MICYGVSSGPRDMIFMFFFLHVGSVVLRRVLSSGYEGAKELGVSIFPRFSLFNGELRSYFEFPNHLKGYMMYKWWLDCLHLEKCAGVDYPWLTREWF